MTIEELEEEAGVIEDALESGDLGDEETELAELRLEAISEELQDLAAAGELAADEMDGEDLDPAIEQLEGDEGGAVDPIDITYHRSGEVEHRLFLEDPRTVIGFTYGLERQVLLKMNAEEEAEWVPATKANFLRAKPGEVKVVGYNVTSLLLVTGASHQVNLVFERYETLVAWAKSGYQVIGS